MTTAHRFTFDVTKHTPGGVGWWAGWTTTEHAPVVYLIPSLSTQLPGVPRDLNARCTGCTYRFHHSPRGFPLHTHIPTTCTLCGVDTPAPFRISTVFYVFHESIRNYTHNLRVRVVFSGTEFNPRFGIHLAPILISSGMFRTLIWIHNLSFNPVFYGLERCFRERNWHPIRAEYWAPLGMFCVLT